MAEDASLKVACLTLFAVFIAMVSFGISNTIWKRQCIDRGVAEYDRVTGEWKWTVEIKEVVDESAK